MIQAFDGKGKRQPRFDDQPFKAVRQASHRVLDLDVRWQIELLLKEYKSYARLRSFDTATAATVYCRVANLTYGWHRIDEQGKIVTGRSA